MKNFKRLVSIAFIACFIASCKQDAPLPDGANDNFISSLTLTVADKTYTTSIDKTSNEITVSVPYTVSLSGAVAKLDYSPHAKIMPEPSTVKDWDNERIFRVISQNGESRKYIYRVVKEEIKSDDTVQLLTQADVDACAEKDFTIIAGDLIIGSNESISDSIENLKGLSKIKEVVGSIIIGDNYKGQDLADLMNITKIGGLFIGKEERSKCPNLFMVDLLGLKEITGDLKVFSLSCKWILADKLEKIGGSLIVSSPLIEDISLKKLVEVEKNLSITGSSLNYKASGTMPTLSFPELNRVGDSIWIGYHARMQTISFEKLSYAGRLDIRVPVPLENLVLPELKEVETDILLKSDVGSASSGGLTSSLYNESLKRIDGLTKLEKLGGTFTVDNINRIEELPDFTALKSIQNISLNGQGINHKSIIPCLNIHNAKFSGGKISIVNTNLEKIIGSGEMNCDLLILRSSSIPKIENISSVNTFAVSLWMHRKGNNDYIIKGIKNVIKNAIFLADSWQNEPPPLKEGKYLIEDLETVGGALILVNENYNFISDATPGSLSVPNLKSVGGQLVINMPIEEINLDNLEEVGLNADAPSEIEIAFAPPYKDPRKIPLNYAVWIRGLKKRDNFTLPKLKTIGNRGFLLDLRYSSGLTGTYTVSLPQLETIKSILHVLGHPKQTTEGLHKINLPIITKIDAIEIKNCLELKDFSTFAPIIEGITADKWKITNCAYNPSYQDMVDGKYIGE